MTINLENGARFKDDTVLMWIEGGELFFKAAEDGGPVKLTSAEAREIANLLLKSADALDK